MHLKSKFLQRSNRFFLLAVLLVVVLSPFNFESSFLVKPETFKMVIGVPVAFFLLLCWFGLRLSGTQISGAVKNLVLFNVPSNRIVAAFIIWCTLSLLWGDYLLDGVVVLSHYVAAVIAYFLVLHNVRDEKDVQFWVNSIVYIALLISIVGMLQYVFDFSWIRQAVKPSAMFGNKNMAAHFITLTTPVVLACFLTSKTQRKSLLVGLSLAFLLAFLFITRTRAAWFSVFVELVFFLGFIVYEYVRYRKTTLKRHHLYAVGLFLGVFFVLTNFIPYGQGSWSFTQMYDILVSRVNYTVEQFTQFNSLSNVYINERVPAWLNTAKLIGNNLWTGTGIGNWLNSYAFYHDVVASDVIYNDKVRLRHLHNDHLELFAMVGIVGYGLFLWLLGRGVFQACRFFLKSDQASRYWVLGCGSALIGICINAWFSFPLKVFAPLIYMFGYVGLIANVCARFQSKQTTTPPSVGKIYVSTYPVLNASFYRYLSQRFNVGIVSVVFVGFLLVSWGAYRYLYSEHFYHKGLGTSHAINSQNISRISRVAISYARNSIRYNPYYYDAWSLLGTVYVKNKQHKKSLRVLERAVELNPNDFGPSMNLATTYYHLGKLDEAIALIERVLVLYPNMLSIWVRYGTFLVKKRAGNRLKEVLYTAISLDRRSGYRAAPSISVLARLVSLAAVVLPHLYQAIALRPNDSALYLEISASYLLTGKGQLAYDAVQKAIAIKPSLEQTPLVQQMLAGAKSLIASKKKPK